MDDALDDRTKLIHELFSPWASLANQVIGAEAPNGIDHLLHCWPARYLGEVVLIFSTGTDIWGSPTGHYTDEPVCTVARRDMRNYPYWYTVFLAQLEFPLFPDLSRQEVESGIKWLRRLARCNDLRMHMKIRREDLRHAV